MSRRSGSGLPTRTCANTRIDGREEAIYNAMLKATTMKGAEGRVRTELPLDRLKEILVRH
jgi:L-aminopeptidase/D-esterase-like protein